MGMVYLPTWMLEFYGINVGIYTILPWILWELLLIGMNFRAVRKKTTAFLAYWVQIQWSSVLWLQILLKKDRHHVVADFFLVDQNLLSQAYRKGFIQPGSMLLDHWWRITMKMLSRNDHPALRTTTPRWTGGWKTESSAVTPGIISFGDFLPLSSCEKRKSQVKKMFPSQWNLLINLSLRKRMVKLPKVPLISSPCFLHLFFRFSLNFPSKTQTVSITGRWIFARTLKKKGPQVK